MRWVRDSHGRIEDSSTIPNSSAAEEHLTQHFRQIMQVLSSLIGRILKISLPIDTRSSMGRT
jgi:hypothetical protein